MRAAHILCVCALGCHGWAPSPPPEPRPQAELTLLYTSDEHGWIAAKDDRYAHIGGVSQLLALLVEREGHCPGSIEIEGRTLQPRPENCAPQRTVLLSGGDHFSGPSISTFFRGRTTAEALRLLNYEASAFGNHELDFGRETLRENRARAGVKYLAANLVTQDGRPSDLAESHWILERNGVRLAVVGVASESTPKAAAPQRFVGLRFAGIEQTLARIIPDLWQAGIDAVVLLAHECHDVITPIVRRHPEWSLSFVGTGHCHRSAVERVGQTVVVAPDWSWTHYARVRLRVDKTERPKRRATVVDYALVDVSTPVAGPAATLDPAIDRAVLGWQAEVDRQLGEVLGHTRTGLPIASDAMGQWITGAWLAAFPQADVALTTKGSMRQELAPGAITLASVLSILPFDNELVVCEVPPAELNRLLASPKAIFAGVSCQDERCTRSDGTVIDRAVKVVTTDFLYYGGDGFALQRFDASPEKTLVDWRKPVSDWTRRAHTSVETPLEERLRAVAPARAPRAGLR